MATDCEQAMVLCVLAREAIGQRRRLEEACGYPAEYGGDELLLARLVELTERPAVRDRVAELVRGIGEEGG